MNPLLRSAFLLALAAPPALAQAPVDAPDPLAVPVLEHRGRAVSAREVLEAHARYDRSLLEAVERDADYRALTLRSLPFLGEVQAYSDLLLVGEAGIAAVELPALLAEAAAWAADRGQQSLPEGVLAAHGIEIELRARLVALQPEAFSTQELRNHMLTSVPEFFHELAVSWIRRPLFSAEEGRALGQEERQAQYRLLDEAAQALQAGDLDWAEAVQRYAWLDGDKRRDGALGLIKRTLVGRYEEPFLRQTFADLGYKMPENEILRGPIMGEMWVYLVRIETVRVTPIVDLNLVRDRVARSLREKLLQAKLQELRAGVERRLLAPIR